MTLSCTLESSTNAEAKKKNLNNNINHVLSINQNNKHMEKFLVGYTASKVTKDEDKRARKRQYEEKRSRSFIPSWKDQWDWLEYVVMNGEGKMFCTICRKYETSGTFVTGSQNFKVNFLLSLFALIFFSCIFSGDFTFLLILSLS